jgi:hypothetical protein
MEPSLPGRARDIPASSPNIEIDFREHAIYVLRVSRRSYE